MALRMRDLNMMEPMGKNRIAAACRPKGQALAEIGNKLNAAKPSSRLPHSEPTKAKVKEEIPVLSKALKSLAIVAEESQISSKTKSDGDEDEVAYSLQRLGIEDIDENPSKEPIFLGEYAKELFQYLKKLEEKFPLMPGFLHGTVTPRMRMVVVDWLFEVQAEFSLLQETLFLAIAILDRYLQKVPVIEKKKVQLVGASAMYLASKYEETYTPDVGHFVYICSNLYTKREFLEMEIRIFRQLNYFLGFPLALHFLRRYSRAIAPEDITYTLAKYFQEICLLEYDICHNRPSKIAAAAMYLALWLHKGEGVWSVALYHYSGYKIGDLKEIVQKIALALINIEESQFQALFKKYANSRLMKVSHLPEVSANAMKKSIKLLKMLN